MIKRVPIKWGVRSGAEKMRRLGWNTNNINLASLKFVDEAQNYIRDCQDEATIALLKDAIIKVKSGRRVLKEFQPVEEFLKKQNFPFF